MRRQGKSPAVPARSPPATSRLEAKSPSQMRQVSCSESGVGDEASKGLVQGLDDLGTAIPGREAPASREPSCGLEREDPIRYLAPAQQPPRSPLPFREAGASKTRVTKLELRYQAAGASLPGGSWLVGPRRSLATSCSYPWRLGKNSGSSVPRSLDEAQRNPGRGLRSSSFGCPRAQSRISLPLHPGYKRLARILSQSPGVGPARSG